MADKNVDVSLNTAGQFDYSQRSVGAYRGDRIIWKVKKKDQNVPFAVIIKASVTPLEKNSYQLLPGANKIEGIVRDDAEPGSYPYAVCVVDGTNLLMDDPEIIIRPPKGG
jgi:hypothetical protein